STLYIIIIFTIITFFIDSNKISIAFQHLFLPIFYFFIKILFSLIILCDPFHQSYSYFHFSNATYKFCKFYYQLLHIFALIL
ncbi:hypothetical protein H311_00470, partial [Anncaliia algerae PRA109]